MHIYPGLNWFNGDVQIFWHANATERFEKIMQANKEKLFLLTGAHIHSLRMAAPIDNIPMFATPAVSPVYGNNPSYANLAIDLKTRSVLSESVRAF